MVQHVPNWEYDARGPAASAHFKLFHKFNLIINNLLLTFVLALLLSSQWLDAAPVAMQIAREDVTGLAKRDVVDLLDEYGLDLMADIQAAAEAGGTATEASTHSGSRTRGPAGM